MTMVSKASKGHTSSAWMKSLQVGIGANTQEVKMDDLAVYLGFKKPDKRK